jgi:hypothetical protein
MRLLSDGWQAIFSAEHGREYFWHRPTGKTTWVEPKSDKERQESSLETGGVASDARQVRARELPEGWCAVYSKELGKEYYWHRPSGKTTWEKPALLGTIQASPAQALDGPSPLLAYSNFGAVRRAVANILRRHCVGDELQQDEFQLLLAVLRYHPESSAKVGAGVARIKVDVSLHDTASRCFWIVRTAWRRMNKKGKADEAGKKRTRRVQKFQKAIVGMSLEDIKKKKAQKPELRKAAQEAAAKEAKARMQKKPAAAPTKAGAKVAAKAKAGKTTKSASSAPAPTKSAQKQRAHSNR